MSTRRRHLIMLAVAGPANGAFVNAAVDSGDQGAMLSSKDVFDGISDTIARPL